MIQREVKSDILHTDGTLFIEDSRVFNSNIVSDAEICYPWRYRLIEDLPAYKTSVVVVFLQTCFPNVNICQHHKVWKLLLEMV